MLELREPYLEDKESVLEFKNSFSILNFKTKDFIKQKF